MYSNYRPLAAAVSFMVHAEHEALLCSQCSLLVSSMLLPQSYRLQMQGEFISLHTAKNTVKVSQGLRRISMMLENT